MLNEAIRHLVQCEADILEADFLADDIKGRCWEPVVHRTHHAREHRSITDTGVKYTHRWRPRMNVGELKTHARSDFPLLRTGVHEEQILLPVVEETEIALRIITGEPGRHRRHGCRFHDGQNSWRSRLEQHAAARRDTVRIARHEGADAIERVGRDPPAVAQTTCQLAVIHRAAAEGRLGEPPHTAKFADLLEDLFIHGALPAGSHWPLWPRANQLRLLPSTTNMPLGKVGKVGGHSAHVHKPMN